jgi:hypothetical protein
MTITLLKALAALVPACMLFLGAAVLFFRAAFIERVFVRGIKR